MLHWYYLGVDRKLAIKAIESYLPSNNRSQLIEKNSNKIYLDAYNANPSSVAKAIENLASQSEMNKIAILGDMYELGSHSNEQHLSMLDMLKSNLIHAILCGPEYAKHQSKFPTFSFFETIDLLKEFLILNPVKNTTILIKGSRGMAMERILDII